MNVRATFPAVVVTASLLLSSLVLGGCQAVPSSREACEAAGGRWETTALARRTWSKSRGTPAPGPTIHALRQPAGQTWHCDTD